MDAPSNEPAGRSNPGNRCPWCSVPLPDPSPAACPVCRAALVESPWVGEHGIPGVTIVDPEVVLAERRAAGDLARAKDRAMAAGGSSFGLAGMLIEKALRAGASVHEDDIDGGGDTGLPAHLRAGILPATYEPMPPRETAPEEEAGAAQEDQEPWRDLPPPSIQEQVAGTEWDPWAGSPAGPAPKPNELSAPAGAAPGDPWDIEGGPWSTDPEPPEDRPT